MTVQPKKVNLETSLAEVARLLLSSTFTGLPVVDAENRPGGRHFSGRFNLQGGYAHATRPPG